MRRPGDSLQNIIALLCAQNDVPRWVVVSSAAIQAIAGRNPAPFGARGRRLHAIFAKVGTGFAGRLCLCLVVWVVTVRWWFKARRVENVNASAEDIFVGFGAGPEKEMFARFKNESVGRVVHLDQNNPCSLASVATPSLGRLLLEAWRRSGEVVSGLNNAEEPMIRDNRLMWMTSVAIRCGSYNYVRTWAEGLSSKVRRMAFISADIPMLAALDARGGRQKPVIEFRQHGLLSKSDILPGADRALAINRPEGEYIARMLPGTEVKYAKTIVEGGRATIGMEPVRATT